MASKIEEVIIRNHDDADEVSPVSEITEERRFRLSSRSTLDLRTIIVSYYPQWHYLTLSKTTNKQKLQYISRYFGFDFGFNFGFHLQK